MPCNRLIIISNSNRRIPVKRGIDLMMIVQLGEGNNKHAFFFFLVMSGPFYWGKKKHIDMNDIYVGNMQCKSLTSDGDDDDGVSTQNT